MALIKEDGSIVANADTYVTATEFEAYCAEREITVSGDTSTQEALLLKAMDYLQRYEGNWKGSRVNVTQPLAWPRSNVIRYPEFGYDSETEIPRELIYAQMALAATAISAELMPPTTANQQGPVTEKTVHGAVTTKYAEPGHVLPVAASAKADALLKVLLARSGLSVVRK